MARARPARAKPQIEAQTVEIQTVDGNNIASDSARFIESDGLSNRIAYDILVWTPSPPITKLRANPRDALAIFWRYGRPPRWTQRKLNIVIGGKGGSTPSTRSAPGDALKHLQHVFRQQ